MFVTSDTGAMMALCCLPVAPEILVLGWSPLSLPRRSRSQVCVFAWYLRVLCPSVGLSARFLSPTMRLLASPIHPERDACPQIFESKL